MRICRDMSKIEADYAINIAIYCLLIEHVKSFRYLGSLFSNDKICTAQIENNFAMARSFSTK